MVPVAVDFSVPQGWGALSDRQLRYVFLLLSHGADTDELRLRCLFRWSRVRLIGRKPDGLCIFKKGKLLFEVSPLVLAELLSHLDWLGSMPPGPVRPSSLRRHRALPADFAQVPLETYIIVDNLYQGYLHTEDDALLDELATVLYPGVKAPLAPWERIAVFYWVASLKDFFARKFSDFLRPAGSTSDGNLLGTTAPSVEEAMNAQIRALTKGDVTKEAQVLALDTWRALTELNAQAREYKEINSKLKTK